jgi:hypothetical protein
VDCGGSFASESVLTSRLLQKREPLAPVGPENPRFLERTGRGIQQRTLSLRQTEARTAFDSFGQELFLQLTE